MQLQPTPATVRTPAENFTGDVYLDPVFSGDGTSQLVVGLVRFTPGARTHCTPTPTGNCCAAPTGSGWSPPATAPPSGCGRATPSGHRPGRNTGTGAARTA